MADRSPIDIAVELANKAVEHDTAGRYEDAITCYLKGANHLRRAARKYGERTQAQMSAKYEQWEARAGVLKADLEAAAAAPKKATLAGGGSAETHTEEGDEKIDPETKKLQDALSSAIVTEKPNVKWSDVAGLEQAKALLKEAVILPIRFPQLFVGKRTPWRGILLYGPPGTGKSFLAKAVATEADSTFLSVSSSDLVSKFQGESERLARKMKPAIIFIDEVDSLCGSRSDGENDSARRIKTEFLVQMQGVGKGNDGVLVLGATNTPWELDPAIRRRFEKRVYIPLPERQARAAIFKIHIGDTPHNLVDDDFHRLGDATEGFSGADVSVMVRDALYEPVRTIQAATHFRKVPHPEKPHDASACIWEPCGLSASGAVEMDIMDIPQGCLKPLDVTMQDFLRVLTTAKPSVSHDDLTQHEQWTSEFGQDG